MPGQWRPIMAPPRHQFEAFDEQRPVLGRQGRDDGVLDVLVAGQHALEHIHARLRDGDGIGALVVGRAPAPQVSLRTRRLIMSASELRSSAMSSANWFCVAPGCLQTVISSAFWRGVRSSSWKVCMNSASARKCARRNRCDTTSVSSNARTASVQGTVSGSGDGAAGWRRRAVGRFMMAGRSGPEILTDVARPAAGPPGHSSNRLWLAPKLLWPRGWTDRAGFHYIMTYTYYNPNGTQHHVGQIPAQLHRRPLRRRHPHLRQTQPRQWGTGGARARSQPRPGERRRGGGAPGPAGLGGPAGQPAHRLPVRVGRRHRTPLRRLPGGRDRRHRQAVGWAGQIDIRAARRTSGPSPRSPARWTWKVS